jgi:hypothetical protein
MDDDSFAFGLRTLILILLVLDLDLFVNFFDVDAGERRRREGDLSRLMRLLDHLQCLLAGIVVNQVET